MEREGGGERGLLFKVCRMLYSLCQRKEVFLWLRYGILSRDKRKQKLHAVYNYKTLYIDQHNYLKRILKTQMLYLKAGVTGKPVKR